MNAGQSAPAFTPRCATPRARQPGARVTGCPGEWLPETTGALDGLADSCDERKVRVMGRVLVVGSLNVDLVTKVERHPRSGETVRGEGMERFAGGKGANQAVAAAQAGAHVALIGCIGSDEDGRNYVQRLAARSHLCQRVQSIASMNQSCAHAPKIFRLVTYAYLTSLLF